MKEAMFYVVIIIFFTILALGTWAGKSKMEAHTFNALTGKEVTTWQAMWVQLRVQEPANK